MIGQLVTLAWESPHVDFHAFAPELVVVGAIVLLILVDLFGSEHSKWAQSAIAGIGLLAALVPIATLAYDGVERALFGGAYVVDDFSLILKALFLLSAYVVVLISTNYIAEGDYWEGEYYQLLLASVLGMMIMASARDLVSIFVALELLSIPAYMLAAWRKRDARGNEAGLKYYLMGVFASAIMLYGMSLLYGFTGTTLLSGIADHIRTLESPEPVLTLAVVFVLIGFAFKVSAVPFHTWAPDVYEGAPTPVTAFLAVASKAAGFVALVTLVFVGFYGKVGSEIYQPLFYILAVITMFGGNLIALRQTNIVRMLAYSGIAQAGYILAPLAVAGSGSDAADQLASGATALRSIVIYLVIYAAMNLGAFAVVIAVARKTRSGEIASFGGLFRYAPGLAVAMAMFVFSLAGIPPLGGWFAKLGIFQALVQPGTTAGYVLAVIVGINSVIALFYYARITRVMFMEPAPDGDESPIKVPVSLVAAMGITLIVTLLFGVLPGVLTHFTDTVTLVSVGVTP